MAVGRDLSLANRLISALPAIERALFIEHCELVELRLGALADQAVFRQRSAYFPVDGFIGLMVRASGTPEAQAALVGNEGMFPTALVLGVTDGGFGFRVQGAGRAFRIDHGALRLLLGENESLLKVLSRYVAACQMQLALQAVCLHHHTVDQRLARWLLMTRDRAHSIELFLTHQVLARMVGARRESVSRAASMFEPIGDTPDTACAGDFLSLQYVRPFVKEDASGKSLHFTQGELQSRMLTASPWHLDVDYTRTMMGFLLFHPAPLRIGMIGLGGGSLAKFCYHYLPASHMLVLENNPHVIALRREFQVPDDDARFQVIAADGALFLRNKAPVFDVLLVDGFDHQGQPAALCSPAFYADCHAALSPGGLLVVNLHYDHADYPLLVARIRLGFGGNAVEVLSDEESNSVVFASKGPPITPRNLSVRRALTGMADPARQQLKPELERIVWQLKTAGDDAA